MKLETIQKWNQYSTSQMTSPFRSGTEVMLALTEELGEIAQEVALLERVGSKVDWQRTSSVERLSEEMTHMFNLMFTLANLYAIDIDSFYTEKLAQSQQGVDSQDDVLFAMANDPAIQRELRLIAAEFAETELDGLKLAGVQY